MSEPIYRVEYLVVIDTHQGFCATLERFRNFLESHDGLVLTKQKIKFKGEAYSYEVDHDVIEGANEAYFHLKMDFKKENQNSQKFLLLLQSSLTKVSVDNLEILRDDFSRERSEQAYPLLYDVENLMRKLITKFMRINVGKKWVEAVVPEKAGVPSRDDEKRDEPYVHNYDFIDFTRFYKRGSDSESHRYSCRTSKRRYVHSLSYRWSVVRCACSREYQCPARFSDCSFENYVSS